MENSIDTILRYFSSTGLIYNLHHHNPSVKDDIESSRTSLSMSHSQNTSEMHSLKTSINVHLLVWKSMQTFQRKLKLFFN